LRPYATDTDSEPQTYATDTENRTPPTQSWAEKSYATDTEKRTPPTQSSCLIFASILPTASVAAPLDGGTGYRM